MRCLKGWQGKVIFLSFFLPHEKRERRSRIKFSLTLQFPFAAVARHRSLTARIVGLPLSESKLWRRRSPLPASRPGPTGRKSRSPRLKHNFRVVQQHVGADVTICAVVKCNAYGHGVEECAPALKRRRQVVRRHLH